MAKEYALATLDRLIAEYACDWVKIDFNIDPGWGAIELITAMVLVMASSITTWDCMKFLTRSAVAILM